jgi:hypothetical protein
MLGQIPNKQEYNPYFRQFMPVEHKKYANNLLRRLNWVMKHAVKYAANL